MGIVDEPDDTPGASRAGNRGAGGVTPGDPDPAPVTHSDAFAWVPYVVGLVVLIGYTVFMNRMVTGVKLPQDQWDRYLYLFSSVEALAFAAAGFFFGREVNRGRAQAAETRADVQANRAARAKKEEAEATAKGQVLADSLKQLADGAEPAGGAARDFAPESFTPPPAVPAEQLRSLASLADRWFPRR